MRSIGNFMWFLCGGFLSGLSWLMAGMLWCVTLIGIPWGIQCFKFASISFFPFKKDIKFGGGAPSLILNIVWLLISGIPLAVGHVVVGAILCVTIIGVPFGIQFFKIAKLALMPFGAEIVPINY